MPTPYDLPGALSRIARPMLAASIGFDSHHFGPEAERAVADKIREWESEEPSVGLTVQENVELHLIEQLFKPELADKYRSDLMRHRQRRLDGPRLERAKEMEQERLAAIQAKREQDAADRAQRLIEEAEIETALRWGVECALKARETELGRRRRAHEAKLEGAFRSGIARERVAEVDAAYG